MSMISEDIRLVIWDLDETFWRGTLSEGGIREYIQANHDIVIELSRRGIMNSICSKNDFSVVVKILQEKAIIDYFVFPSISWGAKAPRISEIIAKTKLRPATVMFIDDNPSNLAEALAAIPELQIERESFICSMLADSRFTGKDDSTLSRLSQYKLLEARDHDYVEAGSSNEAFLRASEIRVCIDWQLDSNEKLDRAVELINRTNQLNFTKRRLPEHREIARQHLLDEMSFFHRQAGLVFVADKYGNYGPIGFFLTETGRRQQLAGASNRALRHFCFSCRTLGMFIEKWLYDFLEQPELTVAGEVLTDLTIRRTINWVTLVDNLDTTTVPIDVVSPEIRIYGGCEANPIGIYLNSRSPQVSTLGNFAANGIFFRINSAVVAHSLFSGRAHGMEVEADTLGMPRELLRTSIFHDAKDGAAFVFSFGFDAQQRTIFQHRGEGWRIIVEPHGFGSLDFMSIVESDVRSKMGNAEWLSNSDLDHILKVADHLRTHYDAISSITREQKLDLIQELIVATPTNGKVVLLLDHNFIRIDSQTLQYAEHVAEFNHAVRNMTKKYPYVTTVEFSEVISDESEVFVGGNHYARLVYLRAADRIAKAISTLPGRPTF